MTNIDMYANKYLGKIFYFCLKKTGNELDAADLSCEISLEIVQALARGKDPEKINAWIWAVARNRWAKWAAKRYYHALEQVDIEDYSDVLPSVKNVEDDIIHSQELECVRRELAFIRSDYRNLLVAHYFEEKSVSQISHQFGIPLGTVKTKLRSSRKNVERRYGYGQTIWYKKLSARNHSVYFFRKSAVRTALQGCESKTAR